MLRDFPVILTLLLLALPAGAQENQAWFETESLNAGLGPVPDLIDRETPRATLESLMTAARRARFEAAAHVLDLRDVPPDRQEEVGADLAQKLDILIERRIWIDWDRVPDRPDALDETLVSQSALAGEPRRSIRLWSLDLDGRPVSIRLNRVLPDGDEPIWVFSRQTVSNIADLYAVYGPAGVEALLPPNLRERTQIGLLLWEVLALPLLFFGATAAGWAVHRALRSLSRLWPDTVAASVLRAISGPFVFGTAVGFLWLAKAQVFVFSGGITAMLDPLLLLGLVATVIWLTLKAADGVLDHLEMFGSDLSDRKQQHHRTLATRVAGARRALIVVVTVAGLAIVLASAGLFDTLGMSLLASAGAITLILGFAARHVLSNIMSSLQIAMNQSARIGDRIVFRDHLCHVERINFTYVQLRDWDNTRIVVPVTEFVSEPFENWTMQEPEMLRIIKIKCTHDADVEALRRAFLEIVEKLDPNELGDPSLAEVRVAGQDVFGMDVWFFLPCADPNTSWTLAAEAREEIMRRGVAIAQERQAPIFPDVTPAEAA